MLKVRYEFIAGPSRTDCARDQVQPFHSLGLDLEIRFAQLVTEKLHRVKGLRCHGVGSRASKKGCGSERYVEGGSVAAMFPFENLPRADVRERGELKAAADEFRAKYTPAANTACARLV